MKPLRPLSWRPLRLRLGLAALLLIALLALWHTPGRQALLAGYLAAWWFWLGLSLGALANLWVHDLTGGAWGAPLRPLLVAAARQLPWLALLFLPLLAGVHTLYRWSLPGYLADDPLLSAKRWWLAQPFFQWRAVLYLALWCWLGTLAAIQRESARRAALGLLAYGFSVSLAAVDWLMSLEPRWAASGFGLLIGVGQMLSGFAFTIVCCVWLLPLQPALRYRDLGNLLLMYVLSWAYLAFTQYLIIWAENLPYEISWYLPRLHTGWRGVAETLILLHFFLPLLILLFRQAKDAPQRLGAIAAVLLATHMLDCAWLVLPSLPGLPASANWFTLLWLALLGVVWLVGWRDDWRRLAPTAPQENDHG
jgi:hypothetical protein